MPSFPASSTLIFIREIDRLMSFDTAEITDQGLALVPKAAEETINMNKARGGVLKVIRTRRVPVSMSGEPMYFCRRTDLTSPKPDKTCLTKSSPSSAG